MIKEWIAFHRRLEKLSLKKIITYFFAATLIEICFEIGLLGMDAPQVIKDELIYFFGAWLGAAFTASIFAFPGWLIQRRYHFKYLMTTTLICLFIVQFSALISALAYNPNFRLIMILLYFALGILMIFLTLFSFLKPIVPTRFLKICSGFSLVLAILFSLGELNSIIKDPREFFAEMIFKEDRVNLVQKVSGIDKPTEFINDDLLAFAATQELGRTRFENLPRALAQVEPNTCNDLQKHSVPSTQGSTLQVSNLTAHDVSIQWIDYAAVPKFYRILRPSETYEQKTFVGHLWRLVDNNNVCLSSKVISTPVEILSAK